VILDVYEKKFKKGVEVGTAMLNISSRVCHCNGCVTFEFNDKSLHTKNDYEIKNH